MRDSVDEINKDLLRDAPSISDSPQYGELTRQLFGGGDVLYGLGRDALVEKVLNEDKLVLHHTIQNKKDIRRQVLFETVFHCVVAFVLGSLLWAWISDVLKINRDSSRAVWIYGCLPLSIFFGFTRGVKSLNDNPRDGWESYKEIDFLQREVRLFSAFFDKEAQYKKTVYSFDEIGLVCYVNHYWEQGPSIDLFLAIKKNIMACDKNKISSCPYISNIYDCVPEELFSDEYQSIPNTEKIPENARQVIDAWTQRTGMDFFDFVTKPNQRKKRKVMSQGHLPGRTLKNPSKRRRKHKAQKSPKKRISAV
jgi:hypothetical protein